jgi:preprotein translocase subunit YajC
MFMNLQALLMWQAPGGGGMSLLIMFVPMIAIFYFLLIMQQQRRQKKWQAMLDQLKTGDRITTTGGLRGIVMAIKDDAIHVNVPPNNTRLEVTKASVAIVTTSDDEAAKTK